MRPNALVALLAGVAPAGACLVQTTSALAQAEPVDLVYAPRGACPDEKPFLHELVKLIGLPQPGKEGQVRTFVVAVWQEEERVHGSLRVTDVDGAISQREFEAQSCDELVGALALATALAMDEGAKALDAPESNDTARPAPSLSRTDDAPGKPVPVPGVRRRNANWLLAVGLEGLGLGEVVPGIAVGGGVFLDVASASQAVLAPSFRLSLLVDEIHTSFGAEVGADLVWWIARAEACPARVALGSLSATACLTFDAGELSSTGAGLANDASGRRLWAVPGVLGRLTWPRGGAFSIEGTVGTSALLQRYRFTYQNATSAEATEVWRMPAADAELGVGAAYRFR